MRIAFGHDHRIVTQHVAELLDRIALQNPVRGEGVPGSLQAATALPARVEAFAY
jgi:hypothetical protein